MEGELLDREVGTRRFLKATTGILCVTGSLFYLYTALFGQFTPVLQMMPIVTIAIVVGLIDHPLIRSKRLWVSLFDYLLIGLAIWVGIFLIAGEKESAMALAPPTGLRLIAAWVLIFLLLETTRRVMGMQLVLFTGAFLLYSRFGNYIPGTFHHWGFEWSRIADYTSLSTEGIFGAPIYVCATIIVHFLIFSALLRISGGGEYFINVSQSLVGRFRGGSAKMAVVASTFFGMISGSAVANVAAVGTITIPLMVKGGYPPVKAASVEALASTGGQFMPPVMGAAAFLMAEIIGRSYWEVCVAAFLPAFLYYISLFFIIDFEAAKLGLKGLDPKLISPMMTELRKGWFYLAPLVVLLYSLAVLQLSAMRCSLYAIGSLIIVSFFSKKSRLGPRKLYEGLEVGMRGMTEVTLACACGGIMVGTMYLTNFGIGLSSVLVELSHGSIFILLVLTAITSLLLGLGLTTSACYLILAILVGPTLVQMGVPLMATHLFILYYGCLSAITPPVATASYAAASLAGTDPMKTGWIATFWATIAYIMPFFFVYHPAITLQGGVAFVVFSMITSILGVFAFACMIEGYLLRKLSIVPRLGMGIGGILMIFPQVSLSLAGMACGIVVFLWHFISLSKSKPFKERFI